MTAALEKWAADVIRESARIHMLTSAWSERKRRSIGPHGFYLAIGLSRYRALSVIARRRRQQSSRRRSGVYDLLGRHQGMMPELPDQSGIELDCQDIEGRFVVHAPLKDAYDIASAVDAVNLGYQW